MEDRVSKIYAMEFLTQFYCDIALVTTSPLSVITKQNIIMWQKGIVWLGLWCQDINKHRYAAAARPFTASVLHVMDVFNRLEALQELMTSWRLFNGDDICALSGALLIPQHCIYQVFRILHCAIYSSPKTFQ